MLGLGVIHQRDQRLNDCKRQWRGEVGRESGAALERRAENNKHVREEEEEEESWQGTSERQRIGLARETFQVVETVFIKNNSFLLICKIGGYSLHLKNSFFFKKKQTSSQKH